MFSFTVVEGRLRIIVPITALALGACGQSRIGAAKEIASHDLADPAAVQFRNVDRLGEHCVVGELNAKNRLGAYTGFRQFIVDMRKREVAITPDRPVDGDDSGTAIAAVRMDIFKADCGLSE